MVHHISKGEQSECITLLEDGVAWLVDGHDHYPVVDTAQAVDSKMSECVSYPYSSVLFRLTSKLDLVFFLWKLTSHVHLHHYYTIITASL